MQTIEIPQDTELTIDWLKERAVRTEGQAYAEAVIRPNSYGSCPLPQGEEQGKRFMMAMGGLVRYLFHDRGDVVEVEYITDGGVRRNLYVDGQEFPLVFTSSRYYAAEGGLQALASAWQGEGHVKNGYVHVVAHRPGGEELPEAVIRTVVYGDVEAGPSEIHEQEHITSDGTWRVIRRGGEVVGSSYTQTATYVPNEPLRQY